MFFCASHCHRSFSFPLSSNLRVYLHVKIYCVTIRCRLSPFLFTYRRYFRVFQFSSPIFCHFHRKFDWDSERGRKDVKDSQCEIFDKIISLADTSTKCRWGKWRKETCYTLITLKKAEESFFINFGRKRKVLVTWKGKKVILRSC